MSDAKTKELITEMINDRIGSFETIIGACNVNVEQCERKLASLIEFFPVDELKYQDVKTGEEFIIKIAKEACKGIIDQTRENVDDHTQEVLNDMESSLMTRIQDL